MGVATTNNQTTARLPVFIPASAQTADRVAMRCPNCGSDAPKELVGIVDWQLDGEDGRSMRILRCPPCGCRFYDNQIPPDYTEPGMLEAGRAEFYIQQGAGLWHLVRPILCIAKPPGSRYLEVGCGFGFGIDFAIRSCGWEPVGIDPAAVSALGRDMLGLPIQIGYYDEKLVSAASFDVVVGSELLEHVTSPPQLIASLRRALKPGGVLALTTPDGDQIDGAVPAGQLVPLLSPGLHLVFQCARSLEALLHAAGFAHVRVRHEGPGLVAFASDSPLVIQEDLPTMRAKYIEYLTNRALVMTASHPAFLAFAGRAFAEAVNDNDQSTATRLLPALTEALRTRYGIDLARTGMDILPPVPANTNLSRLAELVPLNLAAILLADGYRQIAGGVPRTALVGRFAAVARMGSMLRNALAGLTLQDGQTEDLEWVGRAEELLCLAATGARQTFDVLAALPDAPGANGQRRRNDIALSAFVTLVNAGHDEMAHVFLQRDYGCSLAAAALDPARPAERDALFCTAVLQFRGGQGREALDHFMAVRVAESHGRTEPSSLFWESLRGEILALKQLGESDAATEHGRSVLAQLGENFHAAVPAELAFLMDPEGEHLPQPERSKLRRLHASIRPLLERPASYWRSRLRRSQAASAFKPKSETDGDH